MKTRMQDNPAALFAAMSDPTRLTILAMLRRRGELCVCHIHEPLGLSQPKVSRHLAALRQAGLVRKRKEGLWVHYRLAEPKSELSRKVFELLDCLSVAKLRRCCVPMAAGASDSEQNGDCC